MGLRKIGMQQLQRRGSVVGAGLYLKYDSAAGQLNTYLPARAAPAKIST